MNVFFFSGFHKCGDTALDQKLLSLQLVLCRRGLILSGDMLFPEPRHLVLWSRCPYPWAPEQTVYVK